MKRFATSHTIGSFLESALVSVVIIGFLAYFYVLIPDRIQDANQTLGLKLLLVTLASFFILDRTISVIQVFLPARKHKEISFDYRKVSIVIACFNGEKIIGETLRQALSLGIPARQIIVVSDASTDNTARVAREYGVRVLENKRNLQKGLSINRAIKFVTTPYVLVLDDDTHIGSITIPTSLLDEGYAAVSFNVMPEQRGSFLFDFQRFEYRKSMIMGKLLRTQIAAVSNVSGAIGLFRTADLVYQSTRHSGQSGGEDQQRTSFVHLQSEGYGVTHVDARVKTLAPASWYKLFRQRALGWSRATHENFFLFVALVWSPRAHTILKLDRAYTLFFFLSEPARLTGLLILIVAFKGYFLLLLVLSYLISVVWEMIIYLKIRAPEPATVPLLFPFYSFFKKICRYIAYFQWFRVKYRYVFERQYHKLVPDRNLLLEYASVTLIASMLWVLTASVYGGWFLNAGVRVLGSQPIIATSEPAPQAPRLALMCAPQSLR